MQMPYISLKRGLAGLGLGLVALPLIFTGCGKPEIVQIQGTVLDDNYRGGNQNSYSFSVETDYGIKAISVDRSFGIALKDVDLLINRGNIVELTLGKGALDEQYITLSPKDIEVLK